MYIVSRFLINSCMKLDSASHNATAHYVDVHKKKIILVQGFKGEIIKLNYMYIVP